MKTVRVSLAERGYPIIIGNGVLARAGELLSGIAAHPLIVVVTNSKVMNLHGQTLLEPLRTAAFSVKIIKVPDGEQYKTLAIVDFIYQQLARLRADRKTLLVAFGGGVIGDMAGFAAATYLRGIPFVQVPTTFLGQIDSAIGGKTGVNLSAGKNLVGAFYQPRTVLIDPLVLLTLPRREFLSGLYEALKYGIIKNPQLFQIIARKQQKLPEKDPKSLERIITECVAIKAEIVSRDERESGLRMVLNFGHTLGHALEAATNYSRFTHGEAVGHGMIMATLLATKLNKINPREAQSIQEVLAGVCRMPKVQDLDCGHLMNHMLSDKKIDNRKVRFVIPRRIGRVEIVQDTPVDVVREIVSGYLQSGPGVFS
ncbi:MAG TPA: 3-dehydroquinate synthase [Terriglobia bacterium]|nr:3-dehydroquinate synthase [Terriglobia bacterium]